MHNYLFKNFIVLTFLVNFFTIGTVSAVPIKNFPSRTNMTDVTKFGANPHDQVLDNDAIRQAIGAGGDSPLPLILLFPAGTYLIDDTICMSGTGKKCCVTFQGQGVGNTVIKVKENSARFSNAASPKAAIWTINGNMAFGFNIFDLSIDIGAGNPGAIGADWISNNSGTIENVKITSADGNGYCGLAMERIWPGPCLVKNLTIDGFNYGIRVAAAEYGPSFEGITLTNQKTTAWVNNGNILTIHNYTSVNTVPAIQSNGGFVMLVDAKFSLPSGKTTTSNAIELSNTTFYGRTVAQTGYTAMIKNGSAIVSENPLVEYTNVPTSGTGSKYFTLFNDPWGSLKLPIKNAPDFFEYDTSKWVSTEDHREAQKTGLPERASLRKAMEFAVANGKTTVFIPHNSLQSPYPMFNGPVSVPAAVKNIHGFSSFLWSSPTASHLDIDAPSSDPLIIEGVNFGGVTIHHSSNRTVVLKQCSVDSVINSPGCGELFIEDMSPIVYLENPQKVWLRQYNPERLMAANPTHYLINRMIVKGATVWILGLKSEGAGNIITATDGAQVEMLGTLLYPVDAFNDAMKAIPAFICKESDMSLMYDLHAYSSTQTWYTTDVVETRGGVQKSLLRSTIGNIVPLFNARGKTGVSVTNNNKSLVRAYSLPPAVAVSPFSLTRNVTLPKGVAGFSVFSYRGEKIWSYTSSNNKSATVSIPEKIIKKGISVIKYTL